MLGRTITFTSLGKEIGSQSDAYGVPVSNVKASSTKSFSCMDCLQGRNPFLEGWLLFSIYGLKSSSPILLWLSYG